MNSINIAVKIFIEKALIEHISYLICGDTKLVIVSIIIYFRTLQTLANCYDGRYNSLFKLQ